MRLHQLTERTADEVSSDEISILIMTVQNLISRYKRSQRAAADLYHDVQLKGQLVDWMQEHVEPIWEKYGYPPIGQPAWEKVEREIIDKYLVNRT